MRLLISGLILALILPLCSFSQTTTFQKLFYRNNLKAYTIVSLPDAGYGIAGTSDDGFAGNEQAFIARLDCEGNVIWANSYGLAATANTLGPEIILASDGDMVCVHNSGNTFAHEVMVIKVGIDGTTRWVTRVGGSGEDVGMDIVETYDGGFAVGGRNTSFITGGSSYANMFLFKVDNSGNLMWSRSLGYPDAYEEIGGLVESADSGLVFSGRVFARNDFSCALVKTDDQGIPLWTKVFAGDSTIRGTDVQKTVDGGYAISGYTTMRNGNNINENDFFLIKTDANGDTLWTRSYGTQPEDNDLGYNLIITHEGDYAMVGITYNYPFTGFVAKKLFVIHADSVGQVRKAIHYGLGNDDYPGIAPVPADGGYAILGFTGNNTYSLPGTFGPFMVKTDAAFNSGCNEGDVTSLTATFSPGVVQFDTTLIVINGGNTFAGPTPGTLNLMDTVLCSTIDTLLVADFYHVVDTCNPAQVAFTNQSLGNIDQYLWDFGDGATDTSMNAIHTYAGAGTFNVTLTVIKNYCPDTSTFTTSVTVQNPGLEANFDCRPEDILDPINYVGERIYFTDQSTGNILTWTWNFDDGDSTMEQNPVHEFDSSRTYNVQLVVEDDRQCRDTATKPVEIRLKIQIPNVFSPNGDGQFDQFKILGLENYCLKIYDRWGRLVFDNECEEYFLWNGTLQNTGAALPATTYFYTVEGTDVEGNEVSEGGNVTIIR